MSPRKSNSTLESPPPAAARPHRKPQADLYTVLLVLALLAVLLAILFLYLYMKTYDFRMASLGPLWNRASTLAASLPFLGY